MKKKSSTTLTTRKLPSSSDFVPESSVLGETFNPTFGLLNVGNATTEAIGIESGMFSPVDDSEDLTMTMGNELTLEASLSIFRSMVNTRDWSSPASFDVSLSESNIQKYSSDESFLRKDLRFSTLDRKYDLFYFNFSKINNDYKKYCIANTLSYSRPISAGFLSGIRREDYDQIKSFGFKIISSSKDNNLLFLKKNDLNKVSHVEIFDQLNSNKKAEMLCDIAETLSEKIAGLQVYKELKYGSGLLFPYNKPQDVMYHMGSVQFPIDIIFIDSKNKIKKIAKSVLPGTIGTYGSSDTLMVLEIAGGASNNLKLQVGDFIKSSKPSDFVIKSFNSKYESLSDNKSYYIKYASFSEKISFSNFDIFNIGDNKIKVSGLLKSAKLNNQVNKESSFYNIDSILSGEFGNIEVSKLGKKALISISKLVDSREILSINPSKKYGFANFLAKDSSTPSEIRSLFFGIKKDLSDGKKVVIASSVIDNKNILKSLFIKRASEDVVFDSSIHEISFISSPIMSHEVAEIISQDRLGARLSSYREIKIKKIAGAPIDDSIIEVADKCVEILDSSQDNLKNIVDSFKHNSEQYLKNKDKSDVIKGSIDSYNLSCQGLSKDIFDFLKKIKKVISNMNKIKDISTVEQKIEALALSCKSFVDIAESIFELSNKIEEDNFVDLLSAETTKIEKSSEDISNNITHFSDYISKNILNKKVLSR